MKATNLPSLDPLQTQLMPVMPDEPVLPLSVAGYHALLEAGILQEGDPIELLEGFMVVKTPKSPRHEVARRRLRRLLTDISPLEFMVDTQGATTLLDSEPEPDVFVCRGGVDDFLDRHPGPQEIALVAEIADSSIKRDRGVKQQVYARAKVPVYWIVDLVEDRIDVFTDPSGPSRSPKYQTMASYLPGKEVPVVIDGREVGRIKVNDVIIPPTV